MVKSSSDKLFDSIVYVILAVIGICVLFPLLYVFSVSISPLSEVLKRGFVIIPREITLEAYERIFSESLLPSAFRVTTFVTCVGTLISITLTTLLAYPLSRKELPGRAFFLFFVLFTMLFSGGIVPTYIVVRSLGLINTVWAMIWPGAVWTFCIIITKSFLEKLPQELFESARIDGVGEFIILLKIVIPLSMPVIATVSLFYAVGYWNQFFPGIMYITKSNLYPLQVVIRQILLQTQDMYNNPDVNIPTRTMQMAAVIVASVPIIAVYPFVQKHFVKGMLLGSIKG
ncbi:MAG TPA: carbohydrate ABC transporter permease [Clostridiaceae bacterium]|nr:carbohydrate ABC transporter permease [Clostridiaceae bacterium]